MRQTLIAAAVPLCFAASAISAQSAIPVTAAQAEAEAAAYSRSATDSAAQSVFSRPFAGISDRRCVASNEAHDPHASGSLRSGEMIVRGTWSPAWLHAGKANKFLWVPLHGSGAMRTPLVIRADRVGDPADSLRLSVERVTTDGYVYGYLSSVSFPTEGRWLVVATAGSDWGCFVLDVSKSRASTR
jgi:hypothetical protein